MGEIRKLLKVLRFRRVKGDITFGTDDPYTVGQVLSLIGLMYPKYGGNLSVTPVFDRNVFYGELMIKGHLRLIHVVIALIVVLKDRYLRELFFSRGKD